MESVVVMPVLRVAAELSKRTCELMFVPCRATGRREEDLIMDRVILSGVSMAIIGDVAPYPVNGSRACGFGADLGLFILKAICCPFIHPVKGHARGIFWVPQTSWSGSTKPLNTVYLRGPSQRYQDLSANC